MEEELGVVLIHRHASGNTLTEAGRILAKKTDELLAIISSAKSALDELRGDPTGTVTLGLSTGFAGSILHPDIFSLYIHQQVSGSTIALDGRIDAPRRRLASFRSGRDRYHLPSIRFHSACGGDTASRGTLAGQRRWLETV
jgi:DNA-binding transcriptional LysR family regulator